MHYVLRTHKNGNSQVMPKIIIAAVCPLMKLSNPQANMDTMRRWSQIAKSGGADVVLFPETFITGYATEGMYNGGYAQKDFFLSLAQQVPGPLVNETIRMSREIGIHICTGILETQANKLFNTQFIVSPTEGYLGKYRKIQVASIEAWFSIPGEEFPVFNLLDIPTAIMICRDKSFPEIARIYALKGAVLLLNPHCTPQDAHGEGFVPWALRLCTARAMENGCYLVANNPIFDCSDYMETNDQKQAGHSFAIDPWGKVLHCDDSPGDVEKIAYVTIDTDTVAKRREEEGKDFNLWSRLPNVYHPLVE